MKGGLDIDPRGLLFEAYRIEGIGAADCRTIFFDWALGLPVEVDAGEAVRQAHEHYAPQFPGHPMTEVLAEGLATPKKRRGRRRRAE
ncbi:hypothetical protein ACW9UR_13555 [Halovulum sp. GXIMD14794]